MSPWTGCTAKSIGDSGSDTLFKRQCYECHVAAEIIHAAKDCIKIVRDFFGGVGQ